MFQLTPTRSQIVLRFLLERGLPSRFRNIGFRFLPGHDCQDLSAEGTTLH
jgi:hypothetical protein